LGVSSLTTGVEEVDGTNAAETFNAPALSATTGAKITTLNNGDVIDGGAGTDTLNITATATDNTSLTGVTIKGMEIVNITGADNIDASTTTAAAAQVGAKQVQVLDIGNLGLENEVQTINLGDFDAAVAGGATDVLTVTVAGQAISTAVLTAADTATTMAAAIATAVNADTNVGGKAATPKVSASSNGSLVTLTYTAVEGDVETASIALGAGLTADATKQVQTAAAMTVTTTQESSAEIQSFNITTKAAANTNTLTFTGLGTGNFVYTSAAGLADTTAEAAAVVAAINADANATTNLVDRAYNIANKVYIAYNTAADQAAATVTANAGIVVGTVAEENKGGSQVTVNINGSAYEVTADVDLAILSAVDATKAAAQVVTENNVRTAVNAQLVTVLGDAYTIGSSDESGEIKITSKLAGQTAPSLSLTARDSTTDLLSVDATDAATVANKVTSSTNAAVSQQIKYTVAGPAVAANESIALFIDGVSYGNVTWATNGAAYAATALAAAINGVLGDGVAVSVGGSVTVTAPTAGTMLPAIQVAGDVGQVARADIRANVALAEATSTSGDAAIAASSFGGAEQIWLKGDSNTTNVSGVTTQTIGLSGIASMDNEVNYGATTASGSIVINGAKGALSVKGAKLTTLNVSGTGSTGVTLTDGSSTDTIETLNVNASGTMKLTTTAMTDLTAVVSSGKGGLVLTSGGLETITTGEGADSVTASLATVKDNANTAADETKTATVSTGDGADTVVVSTSGTGNTTVETGEGSDTVKVTGLGSGDNQIELGAGNDTAWLATGLAEVSATNVVDAGAGDDTLDITGKATYTAGDYTRYKVGALNFEKVIFTGVAAGNTTAVDASKLAGIQSFQFNAGTNNQIEEVSGAIVLSSQIPTGSVAPYTGARSWTAATGITASSLGYELDSDDVTAGNQTTYGGDLNITVGGFGVGALTGNAITVVANAASTTVTAVAVKGSTTPAVANSEPNVTVTGDTKAVTFVLSSSRVASAAANTEIMAAATIDVDGTGVDLANTVLESVTVMGAGVVVVDASDATEANNGAAETPSGKLVLIDLSKMTAFANLNLLGESEGGVNGYNNTSISTVTLNDAVAETVKLGAAKDTVNTKSTVKFTDSIEGFQLAATADTTDADDTVDVDVSDVLDIVGAAHTIVADDTAYSSLDAALLALSATSAKKAAFHADGNTYIYINSADTVLDDTDTLVELVGTLDLDLLVNVAG
jgi:S-layer protein